MPAQPGLRLPGFRGDRPPRPARRPALADVIRDAVVAEAGSYLPGALARRVPLGRVRGPGQPVPAQRGLYRLVAQASLIGDHVDGAVAMNAPHQVRS